MTARRFVISGRVQGVGFRYFVMMLARERGLAGWTRNLPDGRVEVLAQGEAADLDGLRAELAEGPRHAQVEDVESGETEADPALSGFSVRH